MKTCRRIAGASLGALLAVSLAMLGGGAALGQDKAAVSASGGGATDEGWVYLGRRSGERWRPASPAVTDPGYPVKPGAKLVVKRDALVYGAVDCKVIDAADFKVGEGAGMALLVKAGPAALEVLRNAVECPSIGQASTVWASVRIPADRLVTLQR